MARRDDAEIVAVIRECLDHLAGSADSGWSTGTVAALQESLAQMLIQIERHAPANPGWLDILFAPTGDLQETAIDNGWGDALLELAARFERALG